MVWKVQLLLFLAVMTNTDAEGHHDYPSQLMHAVNSLNRLLDYMLEPRSVIGDMIFGVVLARGRYEGVTMVDLLSEYYVVYYPSCGPRILGLYMACTAFWEFVNIIFV
jgi:hypothetical protein